MNNCSDYTALHENELGKVGYCYDCESYHLKMRGLLCVVSVEQLSNVEKSLKKMKADFERNKNINDIEIEVQIKIAYNTYLCLTYTEVENGLELINMGRHMKHINDFIL